MTQYDAGGELVGRWQQWVFTKSNAFQLKTDLVRMTQYDGQRLGFSSNVAGSGSRMLLAEAAPLIFMAES